MNEPTDDRLHEWVRQTVRPYEAPDDPQADWLRIRRELRRQRWGRRGIVAGLVGLVVVLLVGLGWNQLITNPENTNRIVQRTERPSGKRNGPAEAAKRKQTEGETTKIEPVVRAAKSVRFQRWLGTDTPSDEQTQPVPWVLSIDRLSPSTQKLNTSVPSASRELTVPYFGPDEWAIRQQIQTATFGSDSITYRVLDRNAARWPDAVIVCDMTSSMYPYSTQLMTWFDKQANRRGRAIKGVIFFTDCDSTGYETRPDGPPGQFFVAATAETSVLLPVLLQASRHTRLNRFPAENDLEALLFAQEQFPTVKNLILIADNGSPVKGMDKLSRLTKPVRVILAGAHTDSTQAFQQDYEAIARQSGGSLHTLEHDLDPTRLEQTPMLRVGNHYYRYVARKKSYRLTKFTHRPARLLGPIWW